MRTAPSRWRGFWSGAHPRGSRSGPSCVRCHTCPSQYQVSLIKQEVGPNLAFISLSHSKVLKLFMPVTAPSLLPLPKVILIKSEPYFPTTARPQAFPFLKTARTQRVQCESKGTFFPSRCQQTLLLPRVTLLPAFCFGTLLPPHISCHAPMQPHHEAPHRLPSTSTTPDSTMPRFPPAQQPVRAPSECPAFCQPGAGQGMLPMARVCSPAQSRSRCPGRAQPQELISYYHKLKY